ncbi:hypothetical protein BGZ54_009494 [Gamsiella multidivaricata]|nr:hypothetical protein BGZ54_009494 [Gamsiella multidivaricata]
MSDHLNTLTTSGTNNSAANSPTASPRVVPIPPEASALLQSLLRENNIVMPTNANANANTISQDFCLFEANESAFDYPLFAESLKLQQQQQQHPTNIITTNPLCTPQTPSMDLPEGNNRSMDSFGFDGFSAFLEESASSHSAPSVALIHLNEDPFDNAMNRASCADGLMSQQSQQSAPSLMNTPFTPYLDTPFETPYLADFGWDNKRTSQVLFGAGQDMANGCGNSHGRNQPPVIACSLFPEYDFDIAAALEGCAYNTIEPATLLMASPAIHHPTDFLDDNASDTSSSASDLSLGSPSPSPAPVKALSEDFLDSESEDLEQGDEQDDNEADSSEDNDENDLDDDDDEYVPSRSQASASAMSGFKRKAPSSFASGRATNRTSIDDATPANPCKRTRPELASPFGGKKSTRKKKPDADKRFLCIHPGCGRRFARLFNLHTHERTHDPCQVRPFVCPALHCTKAFSRKHDLQRHEASVHKGERNYKCPTCFKPFSRQDGLRRHLVVKGSICATGRVDDAAETETGWSAT